MPLIHFAGNIILFLIFLGTGYFCSKNKKLACIGLGAAVCIFAAHFVMILRPDLFTQVFPFPDLIFYSNLLPFAVAIGIPCAWAFSKGKNQKVRITLLGVILLSLSLWEFGYFWHQAAQTHSTYIDKDGVCRQTSSDTCSAAAAVTLLGLHGVYVDESDVVEAALTKMNRGTRNLGLYRGVCKLAAPLPGVRIRFRNLKLEELFTLDNPAIITVGLRNPPSSSIERDLIEKYNWSAGIMHDVVYLGQDVNDENFVIIAEPDFGLEHWPVYHLEALFQGSAIYIEGASPQISSEQ